MKERMQNQVWKLKQEAANASTLQERYDLLREAARIQAIVDSM